MHGLLFQDNAVQKSIFSKDNEHFLALLREIREVAGITQTDLAKELGKTQTFISKVERGETRLDFLQLRTFLKAIGTTVSDFGQRFEQVLKDQANKSKLTVRRSEVRRK